VSAADPRYTVVPQRERLRARAAQDGAGSRDADGRVVVDDHVAEDEGSTAD
jgi:hypothetical protein